MPKLFLIIFLLCVTGAAYSQGFVGTTKRQVKRTLAKYAKNTHISPVVNETESIYEFLIRDTNFRHADFVFSFDKRNKCIEETRAACDSCVNKYLKDALAKKQYNWVQVATNTYVSKYSRHLLMEMIPAQEIHRLVIKKTNWNRDEYQSYIKAGSPVK